MQAEIGSAAGGPAGMRIGVSSGDHSLRSQHVIINEIATNGLTDKTAVENESRDLRTFHDEFDLSSLSVISQVNLKVAKDKQVKNMLTGQEESVDTIISSDGKPVETWIWEGEREGQIYKEVLDKYHAVAKSPKDVTALWISFRPEDRENKGSNNRIYKLEKKGEDVILTSYTAGGSRDSMWNLLDNISGTKHDKSNSLHGQTAFFHQGKEILTNQKIFDALKSSLTPQEQYGSSFYLNKFSRELDIDDASREKINNEKESRFAEMINKKMIEYGTNHQIAFGLVVQAIAYEVREKRDKFWTSEQADLPAQLVSFDPIRETGEKYYLEEKEVIPELAEKHYIPLSEQEKSALFVYQTFIDKSNVFLEEQFKTEEKKENTLNNDAEIENEMETVGTSETEIGKIKDIEEIFSKVEKSIESVLVGLALLKIGQAQQNTKIASMSPEDPLDISSDHFVRNENDFASVAWELITPALIYFVENINALQAPVVEIADDLKDEDLIEAVIIGLSLLENDSINDLNDEISRKEDIGNFEIGLEEDLLAPALIYLMDQVIIRETGKEKEEVGNTATSVDESQVNTPMGEKEFKIEETLNSYEVGLILSGMNETGIPSSQILEGTENTGINMQQKNIKATFLVPAFLQILKDIDNETECIAKKEKNPQAEENQVEITKGLYLNTNIEDKNKINLTAFVNMLISDRPEYEFIKAEGNSALHQLEEPDFVEEIHDGDQNSPIDYRVEILVSKTEKIIKEITKDGQKGIEISPEEKDSRDKAVSRVMGVAKEASRNIRDNLVSRQNLEVLIKSFDHPKANSELKVYFAAILYQSLQDIFHDKRNILHAEIGEKFEDLKPYEALFQQHLAVYLHVHLLKYTGREKQAILDKLNIKNFDISSIEVQPHWQTGVLFQSVKYLKSKKRKTGLIYKYFPPHLSLRSVL